MNLRRKRRHVGFPLLALPILVTLTAFLAGWLVEGVVPGFGFGVAAWGAGLSTVNYLADQRAKRPNLEIQLRIARIMHAAPQAAEERETGKEGPLVVRDHTPLVDAWQFLRSSAGAALIVDISNRGDAVVRLTEWGIRFPDGRMLPVPWEEGMEVGGKTLLPYTLKPGELFSQYIDWKTWRRKLIAMEYKDEVKVRAYCQDHKQQIHVGGWEKIPART